MKEYDEFKEKVKKFSTLNGDQDKYTTMVNLDEMMKAFVTLLDKWELQEKPKRKKKNDNT